MDENVPRLTACHEVDLEVDAGEPTTSRSLSVDANSGLVLATSGSQSLYVGNANDWIGTASPKHRCEQNVGIAQYSAAEEASAVTSMSINCYTRNGVGNPLVALLRGSMVTVLDVKTGGSVGWKQSPDGMKWCSLEWHPEEEAILVVATQAHLCIFMAGDALNGSENELLTVITMEPLTVGRPQRSTVSWLSNGNGFAVHWGGDIEVVEWLHYSTGRFSRSACTLANASRKKVLLGIGGQLRSMASGPHNSLLAITDAELCFHLSRGDMEASLKLPVDDASRVQERNENGDGGEVIDLRGQWQGLHYPTEVPRLNGVPRGLLLDSMMDTTVPPAKLCVFWPCSNTANNRATSPVDTCKPCNNVLPLLFPIPDIVQMAGDVALIASRHAPALVSVFWVGPGGVQHVMNVSLTTSLSGKGRIQGLGVHLNRKNSRILLVAKMSALRSAHSIFGPGGGNGDSAMGYTGVKLACFDASQVFGEIKGNVFGDKCLEDQKELDEPNEAKGDDMSRIIALLSSFEKSVTSRLDKIDSALVRHENRLGEMEKKCMGWQR